MVPPDQIPAGDADEKPALERLVATEPPFAFMPAEDVLRFVEAGNIRRYGPGDSAFSEQDVASEVLVVLEGVAYICSYEPEGSQVIEAVLAPVESFGWFSLVDPTPRTYNAAFRSHTKLMVVPKHQVFRVLDESPLAWRAVAKFLAIRLRRTLASQRAIAGYPLARRIAFVICQTFRIGRPGHEGFAELTLSQDDLASMAATSRQSVNRQLRLWAQSSIVQVRYGKLCVLEPDVLRRIAQGFLG